jgi:hypothetical protein
MNPIRIIYQETPDSIPVPEELRHRRTEIILWPLDESPSTESVSATKGGKRRPGAWADLPEPDDDWDSPQVNREIARSLLGDDD